MQCVFYLNVANGRKSLDLFPDVHAIFDSEVFEVNIWTLKTPTRPFLNSSLFWQPQDLQDSFDDFDSFLLESYVQYIFAILLFISLKKSTFETGKRSFFILLKNFFCDWDIQVENLWIFEKLKFHDVMSFRIMKQEFVLNHWITKNILLNNFKSKHSVVCRITNKKFLLKDFYEKDCLETSSRFFCVGK